MRVRGRSCRPPVRLAKAREEFLYTLARSRDQIGDDGHRVGPGLNHRGTIASIYAPYGDQRLISDGAGCPDSVETYHRIRNLLGQSGEHGPNGNVVRRAVYGAELLWRAVRGDADEQVGPQRGTDFGWR